MSLHALAGRWRSSADEIATHTTAPTGLTWDHGAQDALRQCAADLEAALAGDGEAVAQLTTFEDTNSFSARMHDVVHDLPPGTYNLYLHPAGAVQVTDEDIHWLRYVLEMLNEAGGPTNKMWAVAVSRAINAINPGGSRE